MKRWISKSESGRMSNLFNNTQFYKHSPVWIINFHGKLFLSEVQVFQLLPLVELKTETAQLISDQINRFRVIHDIHRDKR